MQLRIGKSVVNLYYCSDEETRTQLMAEVLELMEEVCQKVRTHKGNL